MMDGHTRANWVGYRSLPVDETSLNCATEGRDESERELRRKRSV